MRGSRDEQRADDTPTNATRTAIPGPEPGDGRPVAVTPIVVRPDWCLIEVEGRVRVIASERLYRLWVENVVACNCRNCAGEARP
jgi:hypothetical protein